jgi:hypothetical protein
MQKNRNNHAGNPQARPRRAAIHAMACAIGHRAAARAIARPAPGSRPDPA